MTKIAAPLGNSIAFVDGTSAALAGDWRRVSEVTGNIIAGSGISAMLAYAMTPFLVAAGPIAIATSVGLIAAAGIFSSRKGENLAGLIYDRVFGGTDPLSGKLPEPKLDSDGEPVLVISGDSPGDAFRYEGKDGEIVTVTDTGREIVRQNGDRIFYGADGESSIITESGDSLILFPDGSKIQYSAADDSTTYVFPDGSGEIHNADGTIEKFESLPALPTELEPVDPALLPPPPPPPTPPVPRRDPLALDLNGDGAVETLARDQGVFFDLDNSGFAEQTSWVAPSDGFLVLDRNQNNQIDGGSELFGTETLLALGEYAENGYEALAEFDENEDGQITSDDAIFGDLRVWQDANSDGVASAEELKALADLNIASIDVNYDINQFIDNNNVEHREESSFTFGDGTSGLTNTLWFDSDRQNTVPVEIHSGEGIAIPDDISGLPNAVGFGNAYSLHQAMALDVSGELKVRVEAFVSEQNAANRKALVGDILVLWARQEDIAPSSRGSYVDGQHVGILETFWGQPALQENPSGRYAQLLKQVYIGLESSIYSQLMAGSHASGLGSMLSFVEEGGVWKGDFSVVSAYFGSRFTIDGAGASWELADFIEVVGGISPYTGSMHDNFVAALEIQAESLSPVARDSMLTVVRAGDDHLLGSEAEDSLNGYGGNDRIEGQAGNDDLRGGDGDDRVYGGDGEDILTGDAGNDQLYGQDGNDVLNGGDGRDHLYGGTGNDTLRGGAGANDYLAGDAGSDTYLFELGDGNTTINNYDTGAERNDVLRFLGGVDPSDVKATRSSSNLLLTVLSTGEVITVQSYFNNDGVGGYALDAIEFADGTLWGLGTVKGLVQQSTEGADQLYGYAGADTLSGAGGNDTLYGAAGDDVLSGGEGNDRVYGQDGDDIVNGDAGDDYLYGNAGDDLLNGGDGRDYLYGGAGNDTLRGGAGTNDYLSGDAGSDTYLFDVGDGNTTINNYDTGAERNDVLRFLGGVDPSDVRATRSSDNLLLTVQSTGEVITVQSYFNDDGTGGYALDAIEFADGTVWDIDTVKDLVQQSTEGADQLYGYAGEDILGGAGGNDTLYGAAGDDVLSGGDGNDRLYGQDGNDVLNGDTGDDDLYGNAGDDVLNGGGGRDRLYGGAGNDILRGGAGTNDYLSGDSGNDTYLFNTGDGNTTINNYDTGADRNDVLRFLGGVDPSDIKATRSSSNLLLTVVSTGEVITVQSYFNNDGAGGYALDTIEFTDGTVWDIDTVKDLVQQSTEGADQLYGYAGEDTLGGAGGNDTLHGAAGNDVLNGGDGDDRLYGQDGNDLLEGDEGRDYLYGGNGADTLYGGQSADNLYGGAGADLLSGGDGDDRLQGEQGDDVYRFSKGDGADRIYDSEGQDRIEFVDVASSEVVVRREGNHLRITIPATGDSVLIERQFDGTDVGVQSTSIETVDFSDGVSWDFDQLMAQAIEGTDADDLIHGFDLDESIDGGEGADEIYGHDGADTIQGGAGNDTLYGGDGQDTLHGGSGDDELKGGTGDDTLAGGNGVDDLHGGAGADLLSGGKGDDRLQGEQGDDVYRFSKGDGADRVYDTEGQDRIEFVDVASSEVVARRDGNHLRITIPVTGDSVLIENQFDGTGVVAQSTSIETVHFSDGVTWNFDQLIAQSVEGTNGDDLIHGFSQDETINGGEGVDEIYGYEGADTIHGGAGNDMLTGGTGGDTLYGDDGVDILRGGDGNDELYGGQGVDDLHGDSGADVLSGGTGDDYLRGGHGDDVYRFSKGDGLDTINDTEGKDKIEFVDVTSSEVVVRREGDHLRIAIPSTGDSVLVEHQFANTSSNTQSTSIETVGFSDGVTWDFDQLMAQAIEGTSADDLIHGFDFDELINGGAGVDEIYGYEGADTIHGGAGNDTLIGGTGGDTLHGGDGADILRGEQGDDTLYGEVGEDVLHGGDGSDALYGGKDADELSGGSGADLLSGGEGDDVLHGGSGDDTLNGDEGNDVLFGDGGLDTLSGGSGNDELYGTGQLSGGDGNDYLEGQGVLDGGAGNDEIRGQGSDTLLGGSGDDILVANTDPWQETSNILEGGIGNDQLFGSYGNDTYRFNLGDGQDTLTETPEGEAYSNITPSIDTLEFGPNISAGDLAFTRVGQDLQINHANGTDGVLVKNWFQEPTNHYKVNNFVFADGSVWSDLDVEEASITLGTVGADTLLGYRDLNEEVFAGDGDDQVWGRAGNDVLNGEAGNDYLDGEEGDDHLIGGAGDDNLVGHDGTDILEGGIGNDTLQGGTGADVLLGGVGEDTLFGGDGNDQLDGGADDDFLEAGAGDDVVNGGAGDDQLNGGMGDDALTGGAGNDMYVFAAGSGHDTIYNADGGTDGVMFTGGATEGRISFTRDGDDLVLLIDEGAEGSVRVVNHFLGGDHAIDWVQPDGGYMITTSQINQRVAAGETNGDYDSVVTGTASGEQLVGGSGRDLLEGLAGNDTLFAMGGDDQLEGGAGDDQLYGGNGSGSGSGNDVLIGGNGNDVLVGEDGNDTLMGGAGNDSYYYKAGQGVDVIDNQGGGSDGVFFLDGLDRNRLSYHQDGNDLVILVDGDLEQQVRVTGHFLGGDHAITYVQPTDGGNSIMASSIPSMLTALPSDEPAPDDGSGDGGTPDPDPGTIPTPELGGDDVLTGGSSDDILVGGAGNDTLAGGLGNDRLEGGVGDDTYIFTGGQDVLREGGGGDVLRFGAGITFNQVASGLMKSGDDLVLKVNGGPDQVTLEGFFLGGDAVVETIEFETGGQITSGQIYGAFGLSEPTPSAGFSQSVAGTAGDDSALAGGADSDLIQGFNGNDVLDGAGGDDRLEGGNGDDVLKGELGADTLIGGRGNDLYQFSTGDGQDVIDNTGGGDDTLHFEDISFNQVASGLMKSGNNLVLGIGGGSDSVTIRDFFSGGDQSIDQITFGSGGQLTSGQIFGAFGVINPDPQGSPVYQGLPDERSFGNLVTGTSVAETILASSDADFIDGGAGDDTITGGLGNDYLLGGEGDDTYRFASGDGQDTINNLSNGAGDDQLRFEPGIDESQLWFSRDGDDLVTSVLGSDDQVRVQDWYGSDVQKVDSVHTDDAMITANQLEQLVAAMAAFGAPSGGEVTLTPQEENQVQAAIASSWQPGL
ncbi:calcium-binding protein [Marinobacter sp.]|uniref:calcium-binding protein n=1 Tax=Marinobacter sp. TaxID=50741 RepID=UPI003A932710